MTVQELSRWITGSEELSYKAPLPGCPRLQTCPACRDSEIRPSKMSAQHVFMECSAIQSARARLGICSFIRAYEGVKHEDVSTLAAYVNGFDEFGGKIDSLAHRDRGNALTELRETWQSVWCRKGEKGD